MIDLHAKYSKEFEKDQNVPTPPSWYFVFNFLLLINFLNILNMVFINRGGYVVVPEEFEFWEADANGLDNRVKFTKSANNEWMKEQLF